MAVNKRDYSVYIDNVAKRLVTSAALSPLEYAKTLMQIGFEPYQPKPTRSLFGKPALGLPNVFVYANYIRTVNGTFGMFYGLTPRLCRTVVSTVTHTYIMTEDESNDASKEKQFPHKLAKELAAASASIVISQPFHVVAVRMMAQFVGRETKYDGVFGSLITIYKEEGISGWFSGLMPRLICEIATLFCSSSITYVISTYVVPDDRNFQQILNLCVDYLVKNLFYPLQVVDVCMAVNGCGLVAGSPPLMPDYSGSWMKCLNHLIDTHQTKRGSSLFLRYHTPPRMQDERIAPPLPEITKFK